jgi:2'-5' RNA ligase
MSLRLFLALDPPTDVRAHLAELQSELRRRADRRAGDVKWVAPENLHLTLQFLGAVAEDQAPPVEAAAREAALAAAPLSLEVRGCGAFPGARRPRVLWAGLAGDVDPLRALVRALGDRLAPLGFPPEDRPFSAHVTLGRAREPRGAPGLAAALEALAGAAGPAWAARELVLIRSHLSPRGPRYEPIARAPLGSQGA